MDSKRCWEIKMDSSRVNNLFNLKGTKVPAFWSPLEEVGPMFPAPPFALVNSLEQVLCACLPAGGYAAQCGAG